MKSITVTRVLPGSQAQVFALCTEIERAPERFRNIVRVEDLSPGRVGLGTRWRETRLFGGRQSTEDLTITAWNPPRSFEVGLESCGASYRTVFAFRALDATRTEVSVTLNGEALTFWAKLMAPIGALMAGALRKCLEQDLEDLAKVSAATVGAVQAR